MFEFIFILIAIIICTVIPVYAKNHFEEKYNIGILMPGPVVLNFVVLLSILAMNYAEKDEKGAVIVAIVVYFLTCIYVIAKSRRVCSNNIDIVIAVVANALLPIGIVLIVFLALVVYYLKSDIGSKRKRR